ncbi:MAG: PEP-CTERM sorting domain-containing protein [Bryobacter sp.]|jgi:hypothetical protein|nr:PEP-CTERM sorting domain-containing protein [Bryobacter sp.]
MTRNRLFLVLLAAFALVSSPAWAVTTYTTIATTSFPSSWQFANPPGSGSTQYEAFGTTFVAPSVDNILTQFQFYVNASSTTQLNLHIVGFNAGAPNNLTIPGNVYTATVTGGGLKNILPNIALTGGSTYLAFVTAIGATNDAFSLQQFFATTASDPSNMGSLLLAQSANGLISDFNSSSAWSTVAQSYMAFTANFASSCPVQSCTLIPAAGTTPPPTITPPPPTGGGGDIPEPSTYVLLGSALLGLSILRRRS